MGDMQRRLVFVLAVIGCSYDAKGQGSGTGLELDSGSSGSEVGGTTVGPGGSSSTTVVAASSESSGGLESTTTGTPPEPDTGSTTEVAPPLPMARSCKEVLSLDSSAMTGVYEILDEGEGVAVEVHCDMQIDGGGWTLVARTAPGPEVPFGWSVQRGTLGDEDEPYSLGALQLGLPFNEVLVTRREGFAVPVENAYRIAVPSGFLEDYRDMAYESEGSATVIGDCAPGDGPSMLFWLGYTESDQRYFFRDFPGPDPWGLWSDGFRTYYDNCSQGGDLDEEQGAVFVR